MNTRRDYYTALIDKVAKMQDAWAIQTDHIRTDRPMRLRAEAIACLTKAMVDGEYKKAEGWSPMREVVRRVNVALSKGEAEVVRSFCGSTSLMVAGFRCTMYQGVTSAARPSILIDDFPSLQNEVGDYCDMVLDMAARCDSIPDSTAAEYYRGIGIYNKYHSFFNIMT